MKYTPRLPERNSNVSHEHPLREFLVLVTGTVALFAVIFIGMGLLVDIAVRYIDPELEATLFSSFESNDVLVLNEQEQALQLLMDQLSSCMEIGYPVDIRIEASPHANAYAMPGGVVVVHSALLEQIKTENGLAFVLAHELAHYQNRDHLRGMGRSVVLLATSVVLTGAGSDVSSLLTPVFGAEIAQHSQSRESGADASALGALQCHYGHVGGATEFFALIAETGAAADWYLAHYFASHPQALQRIDDVNQTAISEGYQKGELQDLPSALRL
ncbi:peptidase M48 [Halieaceae bacterium IMCC14734]|uniref:Peptidase M48 n=1 Tax=Candidatus Litorirhabdus singularis TaxID=2518993 RepID=A0ABT3TCH1_9GAMM|nr:M48 family metallopeptidase [Candidatus Litorirhabdus singularis]MCX2979992.1 peptidase M48 [Candidatus Litorirhabdus singularis]